MSSALVFHPRPAPKSGLGAGIALPPASSSLRVLPGCPATARAGHLPQFPRAVDRRAATLRRRILVGLALSLLVLAMWGRITGSGPLGGLAPTPSYRATAWEPVSAMHYVVQPGDTLWSIAEQLAPRSDPRPLVDRLAAAHGGAALVAGERLSLPTS